MGGESPRRRPVRQRFMIGKSASIALPGGGGAGDGQGETPTRSTCKETLPLKRLRRATLAGVALFLVAHIAQAAIFDDDEARRRIEVTNVRLSQLQRQIEDRLTALEQ